MSKFIEFIIAPPVVFWASAFVLLYTFLAYPLFCALFAKRRHVSGAPAADDDLPSVSIIVPALDEELVIVDKITNCLAIDYPRERLEIIVVDDGSTDQTASLAADFPEVNLIRVATRGGKANAMNLGATAAEGEWLCFTDANVMLEAEALKKLVCRSSQDPAFPVTTADVRLRTCPDSFGAGESLFYRIERLIQVGESQVGSVMGVDGGLYTIKKSLYTPLDPNTILDDFAQSMYAIRNGSRVVYVPEAVANESATPSAAAEYRRRVRVSAGSVQAVLRFHMPRITQPILIWQFVSHKLLRWLTPVVWLALLVSNCMLFEFGFVFQATLCLQAAVLAAGVLGALLPPIRRIWLVSVVFYFVLSQVGMFVGLLAGVTRLQSVLWVRTPRTTLTSESELGQ